MVCATSALNFTQMNYRKGYDISGLKSSFFTKDSNAICTIMTNRYLKLNEVIN